MKNARHLSQRGMTLIEIMVTLGIASVLLVGVVGAFIAQTRLYRDQGASQEAGQSARSALAHVSRLLSRTGYGVSPEFALDFSWYDCSDASYGCDPAQRDSATAPDEVVFVARNPAYFAGPTNTLDGLSTRGNAWEVQSAGSTSLALYLHGGDVLRQGQVLALVCPGAFTYGYVTVATNVSSSLAPNAAELVNVSLMAAATDDPFRQNAVLDTPCFDAGLARAFAVDRYRFFIATDGSDANRPRPFLYLDRGMDMNLDGTIDETDLQVVAADVEDLQVAYVTRGGTVFGDGDTQEQLPGSSFSYALTDTCSTEIGGWYGARALAPCALHRPQRQADHPGNVTAVRLSVVARTPVQRQDNDGFGIGTPPADVSAENHDRSGEALDGYLRTRLTTTVQLPNMSSRGIPLI